MHFSELAYLRAPEGIAAPEKGVEGDKKYKINITIEVHDPQNP